ncbi:MAG: peptidoglycan bridge formation glycyltransferase FemA/FemB family protein [Parcubacteria group bacterium]
MRDDKGSFIAKNSPDGGFLQSDWWKNFQSAVGRKNLNIKGETFWNNIFEHKLPIVGKYFYIPRGNILKIRDKNVKNYFDNLIGLARDNGAGWIRIEPASQEILELTRKNVDLPIVKAPHEMQPKELFIIDCTKSEAELLTLMKPKTRYNIKVAEKKGVKVFVSNGKECMDRFCDLVEITSKRQGIRPHPRDYYQKMLEIIPGENIKLYCAELEGEVIAANIVIFFGNTVTYLHGASDDRFRNVMAPYLLQWRQIQDAKKAGAAGYDFGGVKTGSDDNDWAGITRFKQGFSPATETSKFPGNYDIILNPLKYRTYNLIRKIKSFLR